MRLALAVAAFVAASGAAAAQDAVTVIQADPAPVIVFEEDDRGRFATAGDFTFGFGRPTTFDSLRLDVRENLRPRPSFGPGPQFCSPSIPDC